MKNLLFVLPFAPFPLISGGHQAIFNGISCVCNDVNVVLTYIDYSGLYDEDAEHRFSEMVGGKVTFCPFLLPPPSTREKILGHIYRIKYLIKRMIRGSVEVEHDDYSEWINQLLPKSDGFLCHINKIISDYSIDIVQCEMLETAHVVLSLPARVTKVFVEHEIGFIRKSLRLLDKGDNSYIGRVHLGVNTGIEVDLLNRFDKVVVLSSIDGDKLRKAGVKTDIIDSFAIVNTTPNPVVYSDFKHVLSFVGPEWHPSNKRGILWFLENCWSSLEGYQLNIIGKWSENTVSEIEGKYDGVKFLGYVEVLPVAIINTVMIVPILIGSGIRMKILEACATGVPVVSTTIGAEGLPLENGRDCFIADSPEAFVDAIKQLDNEQLRKDFIESAQKMINREYSIQALHDNRIGIYYDQV